MMGDVFSMRCAIWPAQTLSGEEHWINETVNIYVETTILVVILYYFVGLCTAQKRSSTFAKS
jgi:hypothetical protein